MWVNGCRQQLWIQNCGQTAADRDMVTIDNYRNSSLPYPTIPSSPPRRTF